MVEQNLKKQEQIQLLEGCLASPLSSYLKSVGVLKILAHQKDKTTRGRWENGNFIPSIVVVLSSLEFQLHRVFVR